MMGRCTKNIYTCIRFENKRDAGWEISRTRAQDIVQSANKSGLMQNAEIALSPDGALSGAICNCCADCCFPHQLAGQLDAAGLWPLSRYVAGYRADRCSACGRCVRRCPFGAFLYSDTTNKEWIGSPKSGGTISYNHSLCRGCGVCSTGCPENAIEMIRLDHVSSPWERLLQRRD
jgi:Pyruvate/2-oxoacid:ferredoxin oxidoreductase delta subunit